MPTRFLIAMSLVFSLGLAACSDSGGACADDDPDCNNEPRVNVVLLYGSPSCGACTSLKSNLEANDIEHTFLDVNSDMQANQDMHDKMAEAHPGVQIGIPIVDVNGEILHEPTVLQVKSYLWENQEE